MRIVVSVMLGLGLCAHAWAQAPKTAASPQVIRILLTAGSTSQTGQVLEVLQEKCAGINITIAQDKADYFLEASNQPPDVRYVLFNKEGDAIFLASPRRPDNAVKDVCQYLGHLKK
jgi:hypothetical protein